MLIVGLGNPGEKYLKTRHNVGFRVIDAFKTENDFPNFKLFHPPKFCSTKFGRARKNNALISQEKINSTKILLAKPQTFMNSSGKAVKVLAKKYLSSPEKILIIHDDIDLPLGKIKISKSRGSAGHKGIESIIREIKTNNFIRIRIGIKKNEKLKIKNEKSQSKIKNLEKFVLKNFTKNEEEVLKLIIKKACQELKTIINEGVEKAMNEFN